MDRIKGIATKGGWHPKDEKKTSARGDFRGVNQVAKLVGKGKDTSGPIGGPGSEHASAPLTTLKDPASFGPPPKHVAVHGASAGPGGVPGATRPSRSITAPISQPRAQAYSQPVEEEEEPIAAPAPYRANTTGIDTAALPKPPTRRDDYSPASPATHTASATAAPAKPRLPPRLPPRQNSHPDENSAPPPPSYNAATTNESTGYINTATVDRLGRSGVSVPGFGIGSSGNARTASPATTSPTSPQPPRQSLAPTSPAPNQIDELQSRFARFGKGASSPSPSITPTSPPPPSASGTTWSQKQSALRTLSQARSDPSKVSLYGARDAATTANSFRERHGAQVAGGVRTANGINQRYGVAERIGGGAVGESTERQPGSEIVVAEAAVPSHVAFAGKKAPPPPPKKKKALGAGAGQGAEVGDAPPPVPVSSKPR